MTAAASGRSWRTRTGGSGTPEARICSSRVATAPVESRCENDIRAPLAADPVSPVLLVTGGSRGIGAATAARARAAGYIVATVSLSAAGVEDADSLSLAADVRRWEDMAVVCARTAERFGRIDAVFRRRRRAVRYALTQPRHVDVSQIVVRPLGQDPHR